MSSNTMNLTAALKYIRELEKELEELKGKAKPSLYETTARTKTFDLNKDIAEYLRELGEMTSDFYKTAAYRRAADIVANLDHEVESGESLLNINGIGKTSPPGSMSFSKSITKMTLIQNLLGRPMDKSSSTTPTRIRTPTPTFSSLTTLTSLTRSTSSPHMRRILISVMLTELLRMPFTIFLLRSRMVLSLLLDQRR